MPRRPERMYMSYDRKNNAMRTHLTENNDQSSLTPLIFITPDNGSNPPGIGTP